MVGIMDDVPRNAHLRPDIFVSFATVPNNMINWGSYQFQTYVLLKDRREETLHDLLQKLGVFSSSFPDVYQRSYDLEPLTDVYFSQIWAPIKGDINYVYFAMVYLFLISFMTVANYININIAYLLRRVKEIGLRKSFGAGRIQVIGQFTVETSMNCLVAMGIAFVFVLVLSGSQLQLFEHLSITEASFEYMTIVGVFFLFIGLVSGTCPALVFYRINPVDMLENRISTTWTANTLRKVLLFFQLVISLALLLLTSLFHNQVTYLTDKNLGYEKQNKIVIPLRASSDWHRRLTERFQRHPSVESVCSARGYPGRLVNMTVPSMAKNTNSQVRLQIINVGHNFTETMKIDQILGRGFMEDDFRNAVLLNESAYNALGP